MCIILCHERDVFQLISQIWDMLKISLFQGYHISLFQTEVAYRGHDPGMIR